MAADGLIGINSFVPARAAEGLARVSPSLLAALLGLPCKVSRVPYDGLCTVGELVGAGGWLCIPTALCGSQPAGRENQVHSLRPSSVPLSYTLSVPCSSSVSWERLLSCQVGEDRGAFPEGCNPRQVHAPCHI